MKTFTGPDIRPIEETLADTIWGRAKIAEIERLTVLYRDACHQLDRSRDTSAEDEAVADALAAKDREIERLTLELTTATRQAADRADIIAIIGRQRDETAQENRDLEDLLRLQFDALVAEVAKVSTERDEWKRRAEAVERWEPVESLRTVRPDDNPLARTIAVDDSTLTLESHTCKLSVDLPADLRLCRLVRPS